MTQETHRADGDPPDGAECYVLGGDQVGETVVADLRADGHAAVLVDRTADSEVPSHRGDPADVSILEEAGVPDASTVVVATRLDEQNLLIAQLVRAYFDVPRILVLANSPERHALIAEAGHEPICATSVLSEAVVSEL